MASRRPRILLYSENVAVGGSERYLRDLARGLLDRHYDVRIGCNSAPVLLDYMQTVDEDIPVDELPVMTTGGSAAFRFAQKTGIGSASRLGGLRAIGDATVRMAHVVPNIALLRHWLLQHRPDILHINAPAYPGVESCRAAAVAGHLAHVPVVGMTVHNLATPRRWPSLEEAVMDRLVYRSLDTVITVSHASADTLVDRRGFPRCQLICIPNGIPTQPVVPTLTAIDRVQVGLPAEGLLVGAVGRLEPRKGHDYLLRAAARVCQEAANVYFVVVGSGPCEAEYRALAERLGIAGRTVFTGHRSDVMNLLRACDVFVMPSVGQESLPYALLEAMSIGLPVIATRVAGIPEAIQDGRNGLLVAPQDTSELATTLLRLLRNPAERQRLGQAARVHAESEYSVACMLDRTIGHYQRLLDATGISEFDSMTPTPETPPYLDSLDDV